MHNEENLFEIRQDHLPKQNIVEHSSEEKLEGEITRVVFVNEDETYSIIKIKDAKGKEHTVVGQFSGAFEGQGISVIGKWETHAEFGKQLRASKFKFTLPVTSKGIQRYLASGLIPSIGPKRAELIVSHFKEKTIEILDNHSARLLEIQGLGKKTLEIIRKSWQEHHDRREIILYFQSLGISLAYCQKIYKHYEANALNIVKNDPYKLADDVYGIGFLKADNIAKQQNIRHNDDKRLKAGVRYSLNQLSQAGHVCYPLNEFTKYTTEILQVEPADAERGIFLACQEKTAIIDTAPGGNTKLIYDISLYEAEQELASIIPRLANAQTHKGKILEKINFKESHNIKLNEEQELAIINASKSPLSIITGGPGVGKTTIIGELVKKAKHANLKIALAAPTGRAAKRLSESTGMHASTIHRLLKWEPANRAFFYNQSNKLHFDLIIIDEISMLDIQLALNLFGAIATGTTVVLVGDVDQLPSVGPGTILKDLISSQVGPVTRLAKIYRQKSNSHIIPNAHAVNAGKMINLSPPSNPEFLQDFYWIDQEDPIKAAELILKMISGRIPKRFGFNPFRDIQVLTPMTKGECGTKALNEAIQHVINSKHVPQFEHGTRIFKSGDKVMQIVNNYDKGVFNGDIGHITYIDSKKKTFSIKYDNQVLNYEFVEADQIILAYAITVHKSQGSEFPAVIVPCLTSHFIMLRRNLLYTAITRAKKLLIIIGSKKALSIAISNYKQEPRYTAFLQRLKNNIIKNQNVEF